MTADSPRCERCGDPLHPMALQCPRCGMLVHRQRLEALSQRAVQQEHFNAPLAAALWREALDLLPPQSPQHAQVGQRIRWLGYSPEQFQPVGRREASRIPIEGQAARGPVAPPDSWPRAVLKTGGSLLLNVPFYGLLLYSQMGMSLGMSMLLALGGLLLVLVHEFGHVIAMKYYRLSASPPVFIPFLGALINLRQPPPNAKVEAIIGIGGPLLGTIGAAICFAAALATGSGALLLLALFGFAINLFNMIPVPPMDGGRIMAAVSPWMWIVGVVLLFGGVLAGRLSPFLPILILMLAMPRIIDTLGRGRRSTPYYRISRGWIWGIGIAYATLTIVLIGLFLLSLSMLRG